MKFRNPRTTRVEHEFPKFHLSVEPGEVVDVPERFAPFLAIYGSVLVPFTDPPTPTPAPAPPPPIPVEPAAEPKGNKNSSKSKG